MNILNTKPVVVFSLAEIPLFHVLNAKITFGNINAAESSIRGIHTPGNGPLPVVGETVTDDTAVNTADEATVSIGSEDGTSTKCCIDASCFEIPIGYREIKVGEHMGRLYIYNAVHILAVPNMYSTIIYYYLIHDILLEDEHWAWFLVVYLGYSYKFLY